MRNGVPLPGRTPEQVVAQLVYRSLSSAPPGRPYLDYHSSRLSSGGRKLTTLSDRELTVIRRDRVGFVFQSFNLVPTLTALENITVPMNIGGRKPDRAWLDTVIGTLGLADRLGHKPSQVSGGHQRVACGRALAGRPDIIFADGPTGNLDSVAGAEVLGFLRRSVGEFEQTVVMVTHDPVAAGYVVRSAPAVLRPPPTPTRHDIHFPVEPVIGLDFPMTNSQVTGPGRASPVPVATVCTFHAPYAGGFLTAAISGSSPRP